MTPTEDTILTRLAVDDVDCTTYLRRWLLLYCMGRLDPERVSVTGMLRVVGMLERMTRGGEG